MSNKVASFKLYCMVTIQQKLGTSVEWVIFYQYEILLLHKGFIKGWALGNLTSNSGDFVPLVWLSKGKFLW